MKGTCSVNSAPQPGVLLTDSVPPISSASRREIDSPSPVPPKRRVIDPSACAKGAKMLSICDASMPMPVSLTTMHSTGADACPSRHCTETRTSPSSVNFTALPTRLTSTWCRRNPSALMRRGTSGAISSRSRTVLSRSCGWNRPTALSTVASTSKGSELAFNWPASILEKSSTLFITPSSVVLALCRRCAYSCCGGCKGVRSSMSA